MIRITFTLGLQCINVEITKVTCYCGFPAEFYAAEQFYQHRAEVRARLSIGFWNAHPKLKAINAVHDDS